MRRGDDVLFHRLEALGERAAKLFDQPDAGIWELRGAARVHTSSSVMSWACCDRLALIAALLGLPGLAPHWHSDAGRVHQVIGERLWYPDMPCFVCFVAVKKLHPGPLR